MNPDTKLTNYELEVIFQRHSISYSSHSRINSGFSHEVHRINEDLIIKLFNSSDNRNFSTELAVLRSGDNFAKPKLIASHVGNKKNDRSYIIMSFIPGYSLGSRWHLATEKQREKLIKDISHILKAINKLDPKNIGGSDKSWDAYIEDKIKKLVDNLLAKETIDKSCAKAIVNYVDTNLKFLANSKLYPVYWDIHFDNFIVNENFELQAIIDLENVELAALDYPVFIMDNLMKEPQKYLQEEDEKHANVADYVKLAEWYKKYYPEMFSFDNRIERALLYQLIDTLQLLQDWPEVKDLHRKLISITRNI